MTIAIETIGRARVGRACAERWGRHLRGLEGARGWFVYGVR